MIICSAIKFKLLTLDDREIETIVCGLRHSNCFATLADIGVHKRISAYQGFIDHRGNFLDRREAYKHAVDCGQLSSTQCWFSESRQKSKKDPELYSEDLY